MHHNKKIRHGIALEKNEEETLLRMVRTGKHNAHEITRARVLIESHAGKAKNAIAATCGIDRSTVQRIRDRYAEGGLDRALYDAPRSGQPPKLNDEAEAHLIALACSDAPDGRDHWTLELLQQQMIKDKKVKTISTVALWHRLKDRKVKPWREKNVVHPEDNAGVR
jgi:transposase